MISVTILTYNSHKKIKEVLEALTSFKEIIIIDTGSTDDTLNIVKTFPNVSLFEEPFSGFGPLHIKATSLCQHDWILSLDSDEVLSPSLISEIHNTNLTKGYVYSMPFHNIFNKKHIKCCGWYPDRHIRLFNKQETSFTPDYVHEKIISSHLKEKKLSSPIYHYSYSSIEDFLTKMQRYSSLFAQQNKGKKTSSISKAVLHALYTFIKNYFLKKGVFYGYEGFLISIYNAHTAFYKYLKLREINKQ